MILVGDVPSPVNPPAGCRFNPRCPWAEENCKTDEPPLEEVKPGHWAACHYWKDIEAGTKRQTNKQSEIRLLGEGHTVLAETPSVPTVN